MLFIVLNASIFIHFIPSFTCSVDNSLFLPSKVEEVKLPPTYASLMHALWVTVRRESDLSYRASDCAPVCDGRDVRERLQKWNQVRLPQAWPNRMRKAKGMMGNVQLCAYSDLEVSTSPARSLHLLCSSQAVKDCLLRTGTQDLAFSRGIQTACLSIFCCYICIVYVRGPAKCVTAH